MTILMLSAENTFLKISMIVIVGACVCLDFLVKSARKKILLRSQRTDLFEKQELHQTEDVV